MNIGIVPSAVTNPWGWGGILKDSNFFAKFHEISEIWVLWGRASEGSSPNLPLICYQIYLGRFTSIRNMVKIPSQIILKWPIWIEIICILILNPRQIPKNSCAANCRGKLQQVFEQILLIIAFVFVRMFSIFNLYFEEHKFYFMSITIDGNFFKKQRKLYHLKFAWDSND